MAASPTIYRNGRLYAPESPGATALVLHRGLIHFVGSDDQARAVASGAPEVDLGGRLVTPAFVDAHVHCVQAGQVLTGLDLTGCRDRGEVLAAVAGHVRARPEAGVVIGHGWDEGRWPDPRPPTRLELDRAGAGRRVYLARVDVHSAVASTALLDRVPRIGQAAGFAPTGLLTREAHHACRTALAALFTDGDRRAAARAALARAASVGIGTVHELGGPHLGPLEDLVRVREVGAEFGIQVTTYWGELASPAAVERARFVGAAGLAGDLCIDGALGSRTAALLEPYADLSTSRGVRYLSDDEITGHLVACTRAGLQAGFHCIGDDAVAAAVTGLRRAARAVGAPALRARRHRLEHVEMLAEPDLDPLAELGVVASMQPAFDAAWGGPGELYEQRLGEVRAAGMNRLGTLHRRGVRLAFGSDAPVTPLAGWATVRAATAHTRASERMPTAAAFAAATRGGHAATGDDQTGTLRAGSRALIAVWDGARPDPANPLGLPPLHDPAAPHCVALIGGEVGWYAEGAAGELRAGNEKDTAEE